MVRVTEIVRPFYSLVPSWEPESTDVYCSIIHIAEQKQNPEKKLNV
jgi:hypothetical protein